MQKNTQYKVIPGVTQPGAGGVAPDAQVTDRQLKTYYCERIVARSIDIQTKILENLHTKATDNIPSYVLAYIGGALSIVSCMENYPVSIIQNASQTLDKWKI